MDPNRWEHIQELFHEATRLPEAERRAFLEAAAGGDAESVAAVLALLEGDEGNPSLLDRELGEVAAGVLEEAAVLPDRIGPYRVERLLGAGGMGTVYLAERPEIGGKVAVKVLQGALLSPARRERFVNEQKSLVHLDHPSIVRLFDADVLPDGTPYFVMEYVEGEALTDYCAARGLDVIERLRLFRDACEAVRHAHRLAIIHRDIKPSNVLVTSDGRIKLLDFGIAKRLEESDRSAAQTQTALRMMTPAYAAPEQLRGELLGVYTDVYALGVVLYELLAGRRPYELGRLSPLEAEKVLGREPDRPSAGVASPASSGPAPPLASLDRSGRADLDVLCLTAMHRDPDRRYRTADALIDDLDRFRRGEPLAARHDTFGYRLQKYIRRNRPRLIAAGAVLSFVLGLVLFYTGRVARARDEAVAEAARTERIQAFMLTLFSAGDEAGPADSLRVVTLLDRGVSEADALDAEPEVQSELLRTLGSLYQGLGRLERADSLLRAALEGRRRLFGPDHPEVAETLVDIGALRNDQGRYEEAEQSVREGLEMAARHVPVGDPLLLRAETVLGYVLQSRGQYDLAVEVLQGVVRGQAEAGAPEGEATEALIQLANTYYYLGEYAAFDSLNRALLDRNRRRYGGRHPSVADNLINLGAVQFQWGHYDEAEALYREALGIFTEYYGEQHPETASAQTALGRSIIYGGRPAEALELLQRSLASRERIYGPLHSDVATTRNELASLALLTDDLAEAERQYEHVIDIYRDTYGDDHYYIGIALSNLASVHMEREEYGRAEAIFRDVLDIFERELPPANPNLAIARIKLGRTLLRQGRYVEAEAETRAGYEGLSAQADPSVSWLRAARTDLIEIYEALDRPERAAALRAEQEGAEPAAVP